MTTPRESLAQTIIYVNAAAGPGGNGGSWGTAFNDLQTALIAARSLANPANRVELWVAEGTYTPAPPNGDRTIAFALASNVALYGGFAGIETTRGQRDWVSRPSILSGDLNADNQEFDFGDVRWNENSYRVLVAEGGQDATAILDGFIVTDGFNNRPGSTQTNCGGGIYINSSAPTIRNSTFTRCVANFGAALYSIFLPASIVLENNQFIANGNFEYQAAAVLFATNLPLTMTNCLIVNRGGTGYPLAAESLFTSGDLTLVNCTITIASQVTGSTHGVHLEAGHTLTLYNSIVFGHTRDFSVDFYTLRARNSCFPVAFMQGQGVVNFAENVANVDADPRFVNPALLDYRLASISPCIDTGSNGLLVPGQVTDLDANLRVADGNGDGSLTCDIGAFEYASRPFASRLYVREGGSGDGLSWAAAMGNLTMALAVTAANPGGISEIWVATGTYKPSPPIPPGATPQEVQLHRSQSFQLQSNLSIYGGFAGTETDLSQRDIAANPTILSGDLNSDDNGDLNRDDNSYHIVVANGVSDTVLDGFSIVAAQAADAAGPFASHGALALINSSPTIRNCAFTDNHGVSGGAVTCVDSSPAISQCTFANNTASALYSFSNPRGGAISASNSSPIIRNCTFMGNSAEFWGGACSFGDGGSPVILGCSFVRNSIAFGSPNLYDDGGAISNQGSTSLGILNSVFVGNSARITSAVRTANSATSTIVGGLFVGNTCSAEAAGDFGAAIFGGSGSHTYLTNCTIVDNIDTGNGFRGTGGVRIDGGQSILTSSVLWGNSVAGDQSETGQLRGPATLSHCSVMGWTGVYGGTANNGLDPLFLRLSSPGPDQTWGSPDDDYGDLRLTNASPAIDSGDSTIFTPANGLNDVYDLDNDGNTTEALPLDILGNPRFVDAPDVPNTGQGSPPVDRGAIEYFPPTCPSGGERLWVNPMGGAYNDDDNWFPCAPTPGSDILFDIPGTYIVIMPPPPPATTDVRSAIFRRGDVTLDLNTPPFRMTTTQETALTVGLNLPQNASLRIRDGIVNAASATIGEFPGSIGSINVSNVTNLPDLGSRLSVTNGRLSVGREGTGNLTITAGGVVVSRDAFVGEQPGSFGRVVIEGVSGEAIPRPSRWTTIFGLTIDRGHVTVRDGGLLQADTIYLQQNSIIDGNGTVQAVRVVNFGEINPGNSPGCLTINGNYEQFGSVPKLGAASGRLNMEIVGTGPGEYDQLVVHGMARLGGGLFITGDGARNLPTGQSGPMLLSASAGRTGQFDVAFMPGHTDSSKFLYVSYPTGIGGGMVRLNVGLLGGDPSPFDPQEIEYDGGVPVAAASADFDPQNNNGPDLVVAVPAGPDVPGSIVVLINAGVNASGEWLGFAQSAQITVGRMPMSVAVGEFNQAMGRDIVVANAGDGSVMMITNNGSGDFTLAPPVAVLTTLAEPVSVSVADFNRDQYDDIVVVDASAGQMVIGMNAANNPTVPPGVNPRPPIPLGPRPSDGVPIDCDDDKIFDFVVASNSGSGSGGNSITIVAHIGNGNFGQPFSIPVGAGPVRVLGPHLNGPDADSVRRRDLVTVNRADGTVSILVSLPPDVDQPSIPRFAPAVGLPTGDSPTSAAAIDVDLDGDLDIAVSSLVTRMSVTERMVQVLRNDLRDDLAPGQLVFAPAQLLGSQAECPLVVLGVDVNPNVPGQMNRVDVVTLNGSGPECGRAAIAPIVVRGENVMVPPPCLADFNHDGIVNSADFFDFLTAFFTDAPNADFNHNGAINSQDFFDFIAAFFAGC